MTLCEELLGGAVESVWLHSYRRTEPLLINGRPWGHGSIRVDNAPADWVCADCGKRPRAKAAGRHTYRDGAERCTPCAKAWCDRRWPHRPPAAPAAVVVLGQQTLAMDGSA